MFAIVELQRKWLNVFNKGQVKLEICNSTNKINNNNLHQQLKKFHKYSSNNNKFNNHHNHKNNHNHNKFKNPSRFKSQPHNHKKEKVINNLVINLIQAKVVIYLKHLKN